MADGHLNKCKECTKTDVNGHRLSNLESIRAYDRERGKLPHRLRANVERTREYRKNNPDKNIAVHAANNAIRSGKIKKEPCAVCGAIERIEKHHPDYSKPLDVVFLCSAHHHATHKQNRIKQAEASK